MQQRYFPRMGGAGKNARLPLPRATATNNQRATVVTFKTSGNWLAPPGVRYLPYVRGKGSDGKAESGSHNYVDAYDTYSQVIHSPPSGPVADPEQYVGRSIGTAPADYCGAPSGTDGDGYGFITCYRFVGLTIDDGDYVPPQAGTDATGFGKTFPGGDVGLPAAQTLFTNIKVVPGTMYSLIVPAGGIITFEY